MNPIQAVRVINGVLVRDPNSGERGVRHDRVTLDTEGSSAPFVRSGPIVPLVPLNTATSP